MNLEEVVRTYSDMLFRICIVMLCSEQDAYFFHLIAFDIIQVNNHPLLYRKFQKLCQCLLLLLFRRQAVCKLINRNLRMAQPKPQHIFAQIDCYFDKPCFFVLFVLKFRRQGNGCSGAGNSSGQSGRRNIAGECIEIKGNNGTDTHEGKTVCFHILLFLEHLAGIFEFLL